MDRMNQLRRSLGHAFHGLGYVIRNEKNFQNELAAAILVVLAMFYFNVSRGEMVVLFMIVMAVLIMELLNTIMERVVDILKPRVHPYARLIKDLMAASVLLTSILAIIIGIIIFLPYMLGR